MLKSDIPLKEEKNMFFFSHSNLVQDILSLSRIQIEFSPNSSKKNNIWEGRRGGKEIVCFFYSNEKYIFSA
jgi:hypothetical protein